MSAGPRAWEAALAVAEAQALRGTRGANPLVGAVILGPDGAPLATGFHAGAGTAHAEVAAISALPEAWRARADKLTLVVTLEPCRLRGRTGPCVEAVLASGLGTVVYAAPDPTVNAGGGERLRAAGVRVHGPADPASAERLNPRWNRARSQGRPFVTAHLAQTLDGRVADRHGRGRWITSAASREHAHAVRSRVGAILVGSGTVLADDPALTVRLPGLPEREVPVIVAGSAPLPPGSRLARRAAGGGDVVRVRGRDPLGLLRTTTAGHILLEGGPTLLGAFLDADLVDELFLYVAPTMLGPGTDATASLAPRDVASPLAFAHDAAGGEPQRLGDELLLHLTPLP